jgi:hypothetical protein
MKTPWTTGPWHSGWNSYSGEEQDEFFDDLMVWPDKEMDRQPPNRDWICLIARDIAEREANADLIALAPEMARVILDWADPENRIEDNQLIETVMIDLARRLREIGGEK